MASTPVQPRGVSATPRGLQHSPRPAGAPLHRHDPEPASARKERPQVHKTLPPQRARLDRRPPGMLTERANGPRAMLDPRTPDTMTERSGSQLSLSPQQMRPHRRPPSTLAEGSKSARALFDPGTPDTTLTETSSSQVGLSSQLMRVSEGTSTTLCKLSRPVSIGSRGILAVKRSPRDRDVALQRVHESCVNLAIALRAEEARSYQAEQQLAELATLPRAPAPDETLTECRAQIRQQQQEIDGLVAELRSAQVRMNGAQPKTSGGQAASQAAKREDHRAQHPAGDARRQGEKASRPGARGQEDPPPSGGQKPRVAKPGGKASRPGARELGLAGGKEGLQRVSSAPGTVRPRVGPLLPELDRAQRAGARRNDSTGQLEAPAAAAEASEGAALPAAEGGAAESSREAPPTAAEGSPADAAEHDQLEQGDDEERLRYELENFELRRQLQEQALRSQAHARSAGEEMLELNRQISELQQVQAESSAEPPGDTGREAPKCTMWVRCAIAEKVRQKHEQEAKYREALIDEAERLRAQVEHLEGILPRNKNRRAATFDSGLPHGFVQMNLGLTEGPANGARLSEFLRTAQPAAACTGSAPCVDATPEVQQLSEPSAMPSMATLEEQAEKIVALEQEASQMKWKLDFLESSHAAAACGLGSGRGPTRSRASSSLLPPDPARGSLGPARDSTASTASVPSAPEPAEARRRDLQSLDPVARRSIKHSLKLESCLRNEVQQSKLKDQATLAAQQEVAELKLKLAGYEDLQRSLSASGADATTSPPPGACQALQAQLESEAAHYKRTMNEEVAQSHRSSEMIATLREDNARLSAKLGGYERKKQAAMQGRDSQRFSVQSGVQVRVDASAAAAPGGEADTGSTLPVEDAPPGAPPLGAGRSSQVATDELVHRQSMEAEYREEVALLRAECAELRKSRAESQDIALAAMTRTSTFASPAGGARGSITSHRINRTATDMSTCFDLTRVSVEDMLQQKISDLQNRNSQLEQEVEVARKSTLSARGSWNPGVIENQETENGPRPTYVFDGLQVDLTSLRRQDWEDRHGNQFSSSTLSEDSLEEDTYKCY